MKKFVIIMSILLILAGTGFIIYMSLDMFKSQFGKGMGVEDENLKKMEEELRDAPPVVYYEDPQKDGLTTILNDGDIFRYQPEIKYAGRKISVVKDGIATEYKEGKLEDGKYTVVVTGKEETITRNFVVDSAPPKVTGVRTGKYTEAQTITFADVKDVEKATLTNKQTDEVIDVKKYLLENETNKYTIAYEIGAYVLEVEDKYGNGIMPITILYEEKGE